MMAWKELRESSWSIFATKLIQSAIVGSIKQWHHFYKEQNQTQNIHNFFIAVGIEEIKHGKYTK